MAIDNIYINNFTVFKDLKIEFCKGINVIIGGNGTGKTQLLKFLYALHETAHEKYKNTNLIKEDQKNEIEKDLEHEKRFEVFQKCFTPNLYPLLLQHKKDFYLTQAPEKVANMILTMDNTIINELYAENVETRAGMASISKAHFRSNLSNTHTVQSVFIPAKEMLTHSTIYDMYEKYKDQMPYDYTFLKIIELARRWTVNETPIIAKEIKNKLEKIIEGTVIRREDGSFWMKKNEDFQIPFSNESDGFKIFGLLWQLIMNESITENSVLFWDEPENSINPENIPVLVEILLELQRHGIQIFVTTHNYHIMNHITTCQNKSDDIKYICLTKIGNNTTSEESDRYDTLSSNPIVDSAITMYEEEISKGLGT